MYFLSMFCCFFLSCMMGIATDTVVETRKLLVLTCETRINGSAVEVFHNIWTESSQPLQAAEIPTVNVCNGEHWEELRYLTKPKMYLRALRILFQYHSQPFLNLPEPTESGLYDQSNLHVILMDSDTFWTLDSVDQLWQVYDEVRGSKHLVVSSETTCWIGQLCNDTDIQRWYANDNQAQIGSMSSFVNSGVIIGQIGEVLRMLDYVVQHNASYIIDNRGFDDQYAITDYVRTVAPNRVAIDYHQQLAGSCVYPIPIDPPEQGRFACHSETFAMKYNCLCLGVTILNVSYFQLNESSCQIYRRLETWQELKMLEWLFNGLNPAPLIWHAHGKDSISVLIQ